MVDECIKDLGRIASCSLLGAQARPLDHGQQTGNAATLIKTCIDSNVGIAHISTLGVKANTLEREII